VSKNIVLLSGSPRKGGNTDIMAQAFVEGARSAGKNVRLFRVADMKIGGCLGCDGCEREGISCIQKDDMHQVIEALLEAEALVLASPAYYFSVSAQLKLAIDRFYALSRICAKEKKEIPIKRAALLMPCQDPTTDTAGGAVAMLELMCDYHKFKWENCGAIIITDVNNPGDVAGHADLEKARELGRTL